MARAISSAICLIVALVTPRWAMARPSLTVAQAMDLVALVSEKCSECEPLTGSATIVGYGHGKVYLVTVLHVLRSSGAPLPTTANVQFNWHKGFPYPAQVIPFSVSVRDPEGRLLDDGPVGLVVTHGDPSLDDQLNRLVWGALSEPGYAQAGRPVHAIGRNNDEWHSFPAGELFLKQPPNSDLLECQGYQGGEYRGKSGGALFDDSYHLLGVLIRSKTPAEVRAIDVRPILAMASTAMVVALVDPEPVVEVGGNVPARVALDGKTLATPPPIETTIAISGKHQLGICAPGYRCWSDDVVLDKWTKTKVDYQLGRIPCTSWPWRVLLCGATAVAATGAIIAGANALAASAEFDRSPSSAALNHLESMNRTTDIFLIVTGVGLTVIAVDFFLNGSHAEIKTDR